MLIYIYMMADNDVDETKLEAKAESVDELPPLTNTTERKLLWKIDSRLVPIITILYLFAFIDR